MPQWAHPVTAEGLYKQRLRVSIKECLEYSSKPCAECSVQRAPASIACMLAHWESSCEPQEARPRSCVGIVQKALKYIFGVAIHRGPVHKWQAESRCMSCNECCVQCWNARSLEGCKSLYFRVWRSVSVCCRQYYDTSVRNSASLRCN